MTLRGFTNVPARERVTKLILSVLILLASVICFPKKFKIAVQNYESDRREMIVLTDSLKDRSEEALYIFGQGYYYISGIAGGTVDELYIGDSIENVDDVTAYYGSVEIGRGTDFTRADTDDSGPAVVVSLAYNKAKTTLFIILYALLCISSAAAGIFAILRKKIVLPSFTEIRSGINIEAKDRVLFLGLSIVYSLIAFVVSKYSLIKNIYPLEICFAALMLYVILLTAKQYIGARGLTAAASLPIYACLYFSVNKICAFTFVDGEQAIMEQVAVTTDSLRHFEKNTARLNYMIMGAFERYNIIGKLSGATPAKVVHWFFGVVLFTYLVWFVLNRILPGTSDDKAGQRMRALRFTVLFCMIFTFNYTLEALKNYNYDLFSLAFGTIAFMHFLYAAGTKQPKDAMKALIWAVFGTLEKQIVWPIMLLCMLEYVILAVLKKRERPYLSAVIEVLKAALVTLAASAAANLWIQHVVRMDNFPVYTLSNLIRPLLGMMSNLVRRVHSNWDTESNSLYVVSYLVSVFLVYAGFVAYMIIRKAARSFIKKAGTGTIAVVMRIFAGASILWMILTGIRWTHSFAGGNFDQMLIYTGFSLNIFTMIILAGFAAAIIVCVIKDVQREMVVLMVLFTTIIPMLYFYICQTVLGRYLNVFGLCAILCLFVTIFRLIPDKVGSTAKSFACATGGFMAAILLAMIDVNAFAPEYINYYPVCNTAYRGKMPKEPLGVERMTAGEALVRYYKANGLDDSHVEMYINYGGQWTAKPEKWKLSTFPADSLKELGSVTIDDISFGDDVYYIFASRATRLKRYSMYPLPDKETASPFMTLTRRGATEAVIYRSNDLRQYFEEVFSDQE